MSTLRGGERQEGPQDAGRLQERYRVVRHSLGLGAEPEGICGVELVDREERLGEERERLELDARLALEKGLGQAGLADGEDGRGGRVDGGGRVGVEGVVLHRSGEV